MRKKRPPEDVTNYLARDGRNRDLVWERNAWRYPVDSFLASEPPANKEELEKCARRLPLVVPGLKVVRTGFRVWRDEPPRAYVWFTWDRESCKARYKELFCEFGAADERLAFRKCSGLVNDPGSQQRLPGIVEIEPRAVRSPGFSVAWTRWGLQQMDGSFCQRILNPNCGGLEALPHSDWRCTVGNEWWLVGSRGDSSEIISLEIQGSPLDDCTKENLLFNLEECRA